MKWSFYLVTLIKVNQKLIKNIQGGFFDWSASKNDLVSDYM